MMGILWQSTTRGGKQTIDPLVAFGWKLILIEMMRGESENMAVKKVVVTEKVVPMPRF